MKKLLLILPILISFFLGPSSYGANKVLDYGFEDWGGTIDNTPLYLFSCSDQVKSHHENATEVIQSYNANEMGQTWAPRSGSYFWIQNDSGSYSLDPSISGITSGTVNAYNIIGRNYPEPAWGHNSFDLQAEITTGEIFIRFWARHNKGWRTVGAGGGGYCKWIRLEAVDSNGNAVESDTVYMHLSTSSISPGMLFFLDTTDQWVGNSCACTNAYDGNWHKYSFYVNYNTGVIYGWYDIAKETPSNACKSYHHGGRIGNAAGPDYFWIQGNFSAKQPVEETYHALDDIEIWDGLPIGPNPPSNLVIKEINP